MLRSVLRRALWGLDSQRHAIRSGRPTVCRPHVEQLEDRTVPSGEPILVVTAQANPFSTYYAEILRAEGLNEFATADIASVSSTVLADHDVVILGETPLTSSQVTMFSDWVTAGGNLIAMRPDKQLAGLLGLTDASSTRANAYLLVNTTSGPGVGVVNETIQYHGTADLYTLNGASSVATLYSNATTSTSNPAVTLRSIGTSGGQASAFTYDLARSVVYTRQGNPAWSGQNRDGLGVIRSNDLFYGNASFDPQPDWVDLNKIDIPQADEQQRLLANLVSEMNLDNLPLPRFWYLPRGEKAAVVMTGDDHGNNGTAGRFDQYLAASPPDSSVDDWSAIRSTSYIYTNTPITDAQAAAYAAQGFEIALHVSTNEADWTSQEQLATFYGNQLAQFQTKYASLPDPVSNRTHAIVWSDYVTQPRVELQHGIRFDTTYYHYGPAGWIDDLPGHMTGSGMPMRFADTNGTLIDVYQAITQLTDESGQDYPATVEALLNAALDSRGYYGVFTANMHTDSASSSGSDAIIDAALDRSVPVVSAKQMLEWLDGRNGSSFSSLSWNSAQSTLSFTITQGTGANGLEGMVPVRSAAGVLTSLTRNGTAVTYTIEVIKGVAYAFFSGSAGTYAAQYGSDSTAPTLTARTPASGATGVATTDGLTATFSESVRPDTISFVLKDSANNTVAGSTAYNASTNTLTFTPTSVLNLGTTYTVTVSGAKDHAGNAMTEQSWSFTTTSTVINASIWPSTATPSVPAADDSGSYELGVKFRSDIAGYITGVRFYKGSGNTGTHVGHLWAADGTQLASATFTNETSTGWQEVTFSNPVAISANTTYVASYFAPNGHYAFDSGYFSSSGVDRGVLHALSNTAGGGNGVFWSGSSGFPSTSFNSANYWVDVVFSNTLAPTLTARTPEPNATEVNVSSAITATFNRPLDPATVTSSNFRLRASGATSDVAATVSYSGLTATLQPNSALAVNTTYTVTVSSSITGADGTPVASDITWSFTTQANLTFTDTTLADFGAGTLDAVALVEMGNGEVSLKPAAGSEFAGTALPTDWSSTAWDTGGTATVSGGLLTVDGARAGTTAVYGPGRSLEFVATFTTDGFQHTGFAVDFSSSLFAMFSTKSGGALYARTAGPNGSAETQLASSLLGSSHRYRIDWTSTDVKYSIDGVQVASHALAVTDSMRPITSDFTVGNSALTVDWMWLSPPYTSSGTFLSRVLDAGTPANWIDATWAATVPAETSLALSVRMGNTATPDSTWTNFVSLANSGAAIGQTARYLQYQASFATTDTEKTPTLQAVTFQYNPNAAPVANNDSYSTNEDTDLNVAVGSGVLGNDTGTNLTAVLVSGPAHGTLTLNSNGSFTYTPASNYNGSDSFTYKANNGTLDSDTATVSLTITAVNDAPVAVNNSYSTNEDTALTVNAPGVLGNDTDVEGSSPTASVVDNPAHGTLTLNANGSFTYTPTTNYNGSDSFTYKINDGTLDSNTATVSITVNPVNDAPGAVGDSYSTNEDTALTINAPGVRANDTDVDGDTLTAALVSGPSHGTLTLNSNGSFTYTPTTNYNGSDSFTYEVNDGTVDSNTATVSLTVTAVNDAPVAGNNSYTTAEEQALNVSAASGVLGNDSDVDGDSLTAVLVSGPTHGTLTLNANGSFTYTPVSTYNGSDSFTYQARDPSGVLSSTATVSLTVTAPTLSINNVSANEGGLLGSTSFTFTVSLSSATSRTITVNYATANGTATAGLSLLGGDYNSASGTLSFQGQTSRTVTVTVHGDIITESNETFFVNLSNASTPISDSQGQGTIVNDDSGLLLKATEETVGTSEATLTQESLAAIVAEAAARWTAAGMDTAALSAIEFQIVDLADLTLGVTTPGVIFIDVDAAGHGWFIDPTPSDDSEFFTEGDQGEQNRVDLLTVVAHEMGHALGLEHSDSGVMQETLAPGVRHPLGCGCSNCASAAAGPICSAVTPPDAETPADPVIASPDEDGGSATVPVNEIGFSPVGEVTFTFLAPDDFADLTLSVTDSPPSSDSFRAAEPLDTLDPGVDEERALTLLDDPLLWAIRGDESAPDLAAELFEDGFEDLAFNGVFVG